MKPIERRALLTVLILGVGGHLLQAAGVGSGQQRPSVELFDPAGDGNPLSQLAVSEQLNRPLSDGEQIDADTASARSLERLPGIGPALARRIVADRESNGPFGSAKSLARVPGIGPATLKRLDSHLSFSGRLADDKKVDDPAIVAINRAKITELETLPGIGPVKARAIVAFRDSAGPFRNIGELSRVPGISPALVDRLAQSISL